MQVLFVLSERVNMQRKKQTGYVWVGDSYDEAVQILTENFSTDIVLYGEKRRSLEQFGQKAIR